MKFLYLTITKILVILVGLCLIGCEGSPVLPTPTLRSDLMDWSPFTSNPCAAPCWYGLSIGKSNKKDVLSTLSNLSFIELPPNVQLTTEELTIDRSNWVSGDEIVAACKSNLDLCLHITIASDILTEIDDHLNYRINVSDAIKYLSDPDSIGYHYEIPVDVSGPMYCEIDLIWRQKQLVLATDTFSGNEAATLCQEIHDTGKIYSGLFISEVRYESVATIDYLLSGGNSSQFYKYSGTT